MGVSERGAARISSPYGDARTFGLKGRYRKNASPIQCPAILGIVHWTNGKASTLDVVGKVLSTI
jgi:hypothetical protein